MKKINIFLVVLLTFFIDPFISDAKTGKNLFELKWETNYIEDYWAGNGIYYDGIPYQDGAVIFAFDGDEWGYNIEIRDNKGKILKSKFFAASDELYGAISDGEYIYVVMRNVQIPSKQKNVTMPNLGQVSNIYTLIKLDSNLNIVSSLELPDTYEDKRFEKIIDPLGSKFYGFNELNIYTTNEGEKYISLFANYDYVIVTKDNLESWIIEEYGMIDDIPVYEFYPDWHAISHKFDEANVLHTMYQDDQKISFYPNYLIAKTNDFESTIYTGISRILTENDTFKYSAFLDVPHIAMELYDEYILFVNPVLVDGYYIVLGAVRKENMPSQENLDDSPLPTELVIMDIFGNIIYTEGEDNNTSDDLLDVYYTDIKNTKRGFMLTKYYYDDTKKAYPLYIKTEVYERPYNIDIITDGNVLLY